jgi:tetratricopeptide (TPR) repeat protein
LSLTRIGNVHLAKGEFADAIESYQASHDTCDALAKADPGNANWQFNLAISYGKLSDAYDKAGDENKSLNAAQQAQAILLRLIKLEPDNGAWKSAAAFTDRRIAYLNKQLKQPEGPQQPAPK